MLKLTEFNTNKLIRYENKHSRSGLFTSTQVHFNVILSKKIYRHFKGYTQKEHRV